ncbi:uncharacterized protein TNCV_4338571 [Trichonephila clavipes]|nr:uncharacterized protein TNCV_4338571 [Trichonephila clavipes]
MNNATYSRTKTFPTMGCYANLNPCDVPSLPLRWRHHLSPSPQFRHGSRGEGNILQHPAPGVSAATAYKTFGPTDLTSTYSVCTRRVFGGIDHRNQGLPVWSPML